MTWFMLLLGKKSHRHAFNVTACVPVLFQWFLMEFNSFCFKRIQYLLARKPSHYPFRFVFSQQHRLMNMSSVSSIAVFPFCDFIRSNQLSFFQLLSKTCSAKTKVLVLTSTSMVEYKSFMASDELPRNFLRSLSSSEFCGSSTCPPLEQPNFSTGLPAQCWYYID